MEPLAGSFRSTRGVSPSRTHDGGRERFRRLSRALLGVLIITGTVAVSGCCRRSIVLRMGSPYDRYDHNRTLPVGGPNETAQRLTDEVYAPLDVSGSRAVHYAGEPDPPDGVPTGKLVPMFSGVALPLDAAVLGTGRRARIGTTRYYSQLQIVASVVTPRNSGDGGWSAFGDTDGDTPPRVAEQRARVRRGAPGRPSRPRPQPPSAPEPRR